MKVGPFQLGTSFALVLGLVCGAPTAARAQDAEALVEIAPGNGLDASTYNSGSFRITNASTGSRSIQRVTFDLSFALFPDMVFDPNGLAGDTTAKCLTADSGAATTGFVVPADPCSSPFSSLHDDGYDSAEVAFSDFGPGELFTFSVDVDPTSIRGVNGSGGASAGSVSGLELSGALITVEFDGGEVASGQLFRVAGSSGKSQVLVKAHAPAAPHLEVLGVPSTPAVVNGADQTIRVTGPAGASVRLLRVEGTLDLAGSAGFDIDPFEANRAVALAETTATIAADGSVDIPVVLTRTSGGAGINLFQAVLLGSGGRTGATSSPLLLQLSSTCASNADCEDSNPCTDDVCSATGCVYQFNTAACDDGLSCTSNDTCGGGECTGVSTCPNGSVCSTSTGQCAGGVVSFGKSVLTGAAPTNPTSLQFGPDGRLYVAQQDGLITAFTVQRTGPGQYSVTASENITAIQSLPNHDDDGTLNAKVKGRLVTGIDVGGTAAHPLIWAASSDPRIGGGDAATDKNLDTNSGIVSRLTWDGATWVKVDLVRGLPRSEENHTGNGIVVDEAAGIAYLAYGGNTNMGAPSNNFAFLPEFAYSAAILSIDLKQIGDTTLDLPTLDDEMRPGVADANDPFGGDDGKNQAILDPSSPVQVYAPGFRNPYDIVITQAGRMYAIDNGANAAWGDVPVGNGTANCTNDVNEPGVDGADSLHFVSGRGYYGGHPNPTRANLANTFNPSNPQSAVPTDNPAECTYLSPGPQNGALLTFLYSTNGLAEYTASNFGNQMKGNLLAAGWNNVVWRIQLNGTGTAVTTADVLFSTVGQKPLDVIAEGDDAPFPGTIWVADHKLGQILVFEPADATSCTGAYDASLDEDGDGYRNDDEIDNGTNPCSMADVPLDSDGDWLSDLNDPDDDNDGLPDSIDRFARDPANGKATSLPLLFDWENNSPRVGGILELGFTGLMTNGLDDYETLFDEAKMTTGGAAGVLTIGDIEPNDALGDRNDQRYAFQLGIDGHWTSAPYTVHTRILGPFLGEQPQSGESMGLFIGNGDQDDYFKIVTAAEDGGAVATLEEMNGVPQQVAEVAVSLPGPEAVDLYLEIDPTAGTVSAAYAVTAAGFTGPVIAVGEPRDIPASWLDDPDIGLAIGIIATSGQGAPFAATWDLIEVTEGTPGETTTTLPPTTIPSVTTTVPLPTTTLRATTTTVVSVTTTTIASQCDVDEDCDDADACTADTCGAHVCLHVTLKGTPCDDGFFCTVDDTCGTGGCAGLPRACSGDGPCTTGTCDEAAAACVSLPGKDGVACDDGNACTFEDTCSSGLCTAVSYCGVPVTRGSAPLASDAQFILRAAVALVAGERCECDVNSDGRITASDALKTLQAAVGGDVVLECFVATGAATSAAIDAPHE